VETESADRLDEVEVESLDIDFEVPMPAPEPKRSTSAKRLVRWGVLIALATGLWFFWKPASNYLARVSGEKTATTAQNASTAASQGICTGAANCVSSMIAKGRERDFAGVERISQSFNQLEKPPTGNRNVSRQLNTEGLELFRAQKFEQAAEKFKRSLRENQRDSEVLTNLALAMELSGVKQSELIAPLQMALTINSHYVPAWVSIAEIEARQGRIENAVASIWISMKYSSTIERALTFFEVKLARATEPQLIKLYKEAVSMARKEPTTAASAGTSQTNPIVGCCSDVVSAQSARNSFKALGQISQAVLSQADLTRPYAPGMLPAVNEAIAALEAIPRPPQGDSKRARVLLDAGLALLRQPGRGADAVAVLLEAHQTDPLDVQIVNDLGYAQIQLGQFSAAAEHLVRALELSPRRVSAWVNLGELFIAQTAQKPRLVDDAVGYLVTGYWFSKDRARTAQYYRNKVESAEPGSATMRAFTLALARIETGRP
jgi:tetratricopeptide (TPR) repeat protein